MELYSREIRNKEIKKGIGVICTDTEFGERN